jgi:hypothetical protein
MFVYGNGERTNVIVSLAELEKTMLMLLRDPKDAAADGPRWVDYALVITRAIMSGGNIHVTVDGPRDGDKGWRKPLSSVPAPIGDRIKNALGFFTDRFGVPCKTDNVEVLCT